MRIRDPERWRAAVTDYAITHECARIGFFAGVAVRSPETMLDSTSGTVRPGVPFGNSFSTVFFPVVVTVGLFPLSVFFSYVLWIVTVKRTAAITPFTTPEQRSDRPHVNPPPRSGDIAARVDRHFLG